MMTWMVFSQGLFAIASLSLSAFSYAGPPNSHTIQWHLVGMVHRHWDVPKEAFTDFDDANEQINMGMAIVIPDNNVLDFGRMACRTAALKTARQRAVKRPAAPPEPPARRWCPREPLPG